MYTFCWPSPAQSFSCPNPTGLMTTFYCLRFETPSTWSSRFPYLHPTGTDWPSYTPRHWVPFSSPHTTRQGYGGGIRPRPHAGFGHSILFRKFYEPLPDYAALHPGRNISFDNCILIPNCFSYLTVLIPCSLNITVLQEERRPSETDTWRICSVVLYCGIFRLPC
jgi:hypothetical protein